MVGSNQSYTKAATLPDKQADSNMYMYILSRARAFSVYMFFGFFFTE